MLNDNLLQLENGPEDLEVIAEMFRAAHSLKGMAGTMGYTELADFTHEMESVLALVREGNLPVTSELIDLLFTTVDAVESMLDEIAEVDTVTSDVSPLLEQLRELTGGKGQPAGNSSHGASDNGQIALNEYDVMLLEQAQASGQGAFEIKVVIREGAVLKSVRAFTVFQALERLGHIVRSEPSAEDLDEERFDDRFSVLLVTDADAETIEAEVMGIAEIVAVEVTPVSLSSLKQRQGSSPSTAESSPSDSRSSEPKVAAGTGKAPRNRRVSDKFVRVETERLDELIDLVGELVISKTQVVELAKASQNSESENAAGQLERVTTELQYAAMKLRMVPVKQVFDRFPRLVRDLIHETGKDAVFEVSGEETELDRSIVNRIGDPLVHLLRNAIDHGLESPEERKAAGKNPQGRLRLEARHEGSHVVLEVSDDGRGIDVDKVKARALSQGLVSREQLERMTNEQVQMLIFEPGFSMAQQVTDISGRGVGMDAVKAVIESLNGDVEVESALGRGTSFRLRLPLTLAIIRALLTVVDGDVIAVPIQSIRENLIVSEEEIKRVHGQPMITLRDEILPLIDLGCWLGYTTEPRGGSRPVIVVEVGEAKVGLVVDELVGQQEIVIKALNSGLGEVRGIAGATVLGNGRVALILEASAVLRSM
ncbi:MAG: chemotaxis protein CheA [Firmicutes bacterium]|nr:chemotaxis protein CheA [Bacillota bacterium]